MRITNRKNEPFGQSADVVLNNFLYHIEADEIEVRPYILDNFNRAIEVPSDEDYDLYYEMQADLLECERVESMTEEQYWEWRKTYTE